MENWGCEFFDDGGFGKVSTYRPLDATYLPMELIQRIADRRLLAEARLDEDVCNHLRSSISVDGLKKPGVCYVSSTSFRFQDGYHRLVACLDLGYREFPVEILESSGVIRGGALDLKVLVMQLLAELYDGKVGDGIQANN